MTENLINNISTFGLNGHLKNIRIPDTLKDYFNLNGNDSNLEKMNPFKIPSNFSIDNMKIIPLHDISNLTKITVKTGQMIQDEFGICQEGYKTTWLRSNWWYIVVYLGWSKFILVEFVPWVIVIILTICTTRTMKNFHI